MNEIARKILDLGDHEMLQGPSIGYREKALIGWMRLFGSSRLWMDLGRAFKLAPQEIRMLILLCKGHAPKGAGEILGVSHGTARTYAHNIYRAFGVTNQTQLLLKTILASGVLLPEEEGGTSL